MILTYGIRLVCSCLAAFFLLHAVLSLAARALAPRTLRLAERLPARSAANLLLAFHLAPPAFSLTAVAALCVPSYLVFEGQRGEFVGIFCLIAALSGAAVWTVSAARGFRAALRSRRYVRGCQHSGGIWIARGNAPFLGVAGILRPKLIVSRCVVDALDRHQLDAAIRHERAHQSSGDNLKRLLFLLAPDPLPFLRGSAAVEGAWLRFTEWAADDRAVSNDVSRSLSLAEALVRVARLGAASRTSPLISHFAAGADISDRVERLLAPPSNPANEPRGFSSLAVATTINGAILILALPSTQHGVHELLERLMH